MLDITKSTVITKGIGNITVRKEIVIPLQEGEIDLSQVLNRLIGEYNILISQRDEIEQKLQDLKKQIKDVKEGIEAGTSKD